MKQPLVAVIVAAAILFAACSGERITPVSPGVHLRAGKAITFFLDRAASDAIELATRESFQLWSASTTFKFSYGGKAPGRLARDGRNSVILMRRWPKELPIGMAAWTQVYLDSSGAIVEADILLNAQAFSFTTHREAKPGEVYIEDILSREIGRSLGVGLTPDLSAGTYRVAASGDDYEPGIDPVEMAAYLSLYAAGP